MCDLLIPRSPDKSFGFVLPNGNGNDFFGCLCPEGCFCSVIDDRTMYRVCSRPWQTLYSSLACVAFDKGIECPDSHGCGVKFLPQSKFVVDALVDMGCEKNNVANLCANEKTLQFIVCPSCRRELCTKCHAFRQDCECPELFAISSTAQNKDIIVVEAPSTGNYTPKYSRCNVRINGHSYLIKYEQTVTIEHLKVTICAKLHVKVDDYRLLYSGVLMKGKISTHKLVENTSLQLVKKQ